MTGDELFEALTKREQRPANDVGAVVLKLNPIATCAESWIFLQRKCQDGYEFTAVPAPFDAHDDARYLRPLLHQGWYPLFADDGDQRFPVTIDAWNPDDPHAALRTCLARWSNWSPNVIETRLRHCRYVAV